MCRFLKWILAGPGLIDIAQVKRACLEPNGMISIIPVDGVPTEDPTQPPTP
jgi:uncharacterized membrane protein YcaP (DUF421 family)